MECFMESKKAKSWIEYEGLDETEIQYLEQFLINVLGEFSRILGEKYQHFENVVIFRDENSDCPMLITNRYPDKVAIRLKVKDCTYWIQMVYQLTHELCHYFIRQQKENKDVTVKWIEETICEAVSLYFLHFFATNWSKFEMSNINQDFGEEFWIYLTNELRKGEKSFPFQQNITSKETLIIFESLCTENREFRFFERNALFELLIAHPHQIKTIVDYTRYLSSSFGLLVDFPRWLSDDSSSNALLLLQSFQPVF